MRLPLSRRLKAFQALGVLGCLVAAVAGLWAASRHSVQVYEVRRLSRPVTVDGVVDDEWRAVQVVVPDRPLVGREPTAVRLAYDADWLYVGVDCTDSQIAPPEDDFYRGDFVQGDICIGRPETAHSNEFRYRVTPHGATPIRFHRGPGPEMTEYYDYTKELTPEHYRLVVAKTPRGWSMELALAWAAVEPRVPVIAEPFRFRISRRNANGSAAEVGEWPYDREVVFTFAEATGR